MKMNPRVTTTQVKKWLGGLRYLPAGRASPMHTAKILLLF